MIVALLWFVIYAVLVGVVAWVLQIIIGKVPMDATVAQIINVAITAIAAVIVLVLLIQALTGSLPALV